MAWPRSFKKSSTQLWNILVALDLHFPGADCGVLVVAPGQPVCQPQGLWLGFTAEESKASAFSTYHPEDLAGGFLGLVSQ